MSLFKRSESQTPKSKQPAVAENPSASNAKVMVVIERQVDDPKAKLFEHLGPALEILVNDRDIYRHGKYRQRDCTHWTSDLPNIENTSSNRSNLEKLIVTWLHGHGLFAEINCSQFNNRDLPCDGYILADIDVQLVDERFFVKVEAGSIPRSGTEYKT